MSATAHMHVQKGRVGIGYVDAQHDWTPSIRSQNKNSRSNTSLHTQGRRTSRRGWVYNKVKWFCGNTFPTAVKVPPDASNLNTCAGTRIRLSCSGSSILTLSTGHPFLPFLNIKHWTGLKQSK